MSNPGPDDPRFEAPFSAQEPPFAPSQPPFAPPGPPKRRSRVWAILGITLLLGFGSCVSYCGYEIYRAQTPEGKRESKAEDDRKNATFDGFLAKLTRVRAALPPVDAPDANCPAGTSLDRAPMLDTLFIAALLDADDGKHDARKVASKMIRDGRFRDDILEAHAIRKGVDGGAFGFLALGQACLDIERADEEPRVVVLRVDEATPPSVDREAFSGGSVTGSAVLVDWKSANVLCHARVTAESSNQISHGGGVRVKVSGIPLPAVGKTDLGDAVAKDFKANLDAAVRDALGRAGAK